MKLFEKSVAIPLAPGNSGVIEHIERTLSFRLGDGEIPIRFAVTAVENGAYQCEIGCLDGVKALGSEIPSIFELRQRTAKHSRGFNAVFVVPTGIGAEVGGHAGDATPAAHLLAACCDHLVTHPNVVNASDVNELPANASYVEGSVISRLILGTAGLRPVRSNRVLVVIDSRPDIMVENLAVNTVETARATLGLDCAGIYKLEPPLELVAEYADSGRAVGVGHGVDRLLNLLAEKRDNYDAVAISSVITVPDGFHERYFASDGKMINPWGGIEAMLTHAVSQVLNVPSAHAPMIESREILFEDPGQVDPRIAAEAISSSFFYCVLKGLRQSPQIVTDPVMMQASDVISAEDVSCLVIPDGCIGLPTLAALEQGIPVVAVREGKGAIATELQILPWQKNQLFIAENYWEAAGLVSALRSGVSPDTVRRPFRKIAVETWDRANSLDSSGGRSQVNRALSD